MTAENSENKMATAITVKFVYTDGGRWHSVDVTCAEWLAILRTGEIDGKKICAMEIVTVNVEDSEEKVSFVYDFVQLATGGNPWQAL